MTGSDKGGTQPAVTSSEQPAQTPGSKQAPTSSSAPSQPRVAKITSLLPASVAGYWLGTVQADSEDAVLSAEPDVGSVPSRTVVRALLCVHDRKSDAAAREWVDKMSRRVYAKGLSDVSVAGSPAVFGTDGTRLAWCAYASGPYVFEVVVTASASPVAAKQVTLKLAEAFRTKR